MARPDVYDSMFKYAKEYIIENSEYSPKVLKNIQADRKFPLVTIRQLTDDIYDENLDKTDQRYNLKFEIEIYTMNVGNTPKELIAKELTNLVNDVFDEHYGMARKKNQEVVNIDTDVYRWDMRYEAKIDENRRIYRK